MALLGTWHSYIHTMQALLHTYHAWHYYIYIRNGTLTYITYKPEVNADSCKNLYHMDPGSMLSLDTSINIVINIFKIIISVSVSRLFYEKS